MHAFNQPLAEDQSDTRARFGAGLLPDAVEWLEKLRDLLRSQPDTVVADADANRLRGALCALDDNRSTRLVVFNGFGKQVDDNLLDPGAVGVD